MGRNEHEALSSICLRYLHGQLPSEHQQHPPVTLEIQVHSDHEQGKGKASDMARETIYLVATRTLMCHRAATRAATQAVFRRRPCMVTWYKRSFSNFRRSTVYRFAKGVKLFGSKTARQICWRVLLQIWNTQQERCRPYTSNGV